MLQFNEISQADFTRQPQPIGRGYELLKSDPEGMHILIAGERFCRARP